MDYISLIIHLKPMPINMQIDDVNELPEWDEDKFDDEGEEW
jgi:hypothetical protein